MARLRPSPVLIGGPIGFRPSRTPRVLLAVAILVASAWMGLRVLAWLGDSPARSVPVPVQVTHRPTDAGWPSTQATPSVNHTQKES